METRAHHVLIGVFVLLACLGAMAFALWLGKPQGDGGARHYQVVFTESVRGLSVGSPVEYNGIAVGDVAALNLDPADPGHVIARIRVRGPALVRQDTQAALTMQGLTGRSVIQLSGGSAHSPLLQANGAQDPVIVARPSSVARMLDQGEDAVANLNALALAARNMLSPDNAAHLQEILANLARMTDTLATQSGQAGEILSAAHTAAQAVTQTAQTTTAFVRDLRAATGAHAPRIASNLDQSAASLADLLQTADALLRASREPLRAGLQGASAIGPALAELRATLSALRTTLERFNQDPAGYLLNRNPLQEFTP